MNEVLLSIRHHILLYLGIFAILCFLIFKPTKTIVQQVGKEYWQQKGFKPDTTIQKNYINLTIPRYPTPIPPKDVITYLPSTSSNRIELSDSMVKVLNALNQKVTDINALYIKLYPKNPKIITGNFFRDSLSLTLLDIDGKINTLAYPVNYDKFKYQFIEGNMRTESYKYKDPNKKSVFENGLYANVGYIWLTKKPTIGFGDELNLWRFQLHNYADITLEERPQFFLITKLGFKLR